MERLPLVTDKIISEHKLPWATADTFDLRKTPVVIVNTDIQSGPGIHWITIATTRDKRALIIDSLGPRDDQPYNDMITTRIKLQGFTPTLYKGKFQFDYDHSCGWFAIATAQIAISTLRSNPDATVADIAAAVRAVFGNRPDVTDLEIIKRRFHL